MPDQSEPMRVFIEELAGSAGASTPGGGGWGPVKHWVHAGFASVATGYDVAGVVHHAQPDLVLPGTTAVGIAAGIVLLMCVPVIYRLFDNCNRAFAEDEQAPAQMESDDAAPFRILPAGAALIRFARAFFS